MNDPSSPLPSAVVPETARVATPARGWTTRLVGDVPGDVLPEQRLVLERQADAEGGVAIAAMDTAGTRLGVLPDDVAREVAPLMDLGYPVEGRVLGVAGDILEVEIAVGATTAP